MKRQLNCIMLIDDDRSTNFLNEMVIAEIGCAKTVIVAQSGQEALAFLENEESNNHCYPELIFLDINMPKMDGWEFIQAYRKLELADHQTCIVMLTSSLNPEDYERASKIAEICDYRHKPITPAMVEGILEQKFRISYS